ncbi:MAG: 2OG-Fe(II) oxygenase [Lysobacter sp.]
MSDVEDADIKRALGAMRSAAASGVPEATFKLARSLIAQDKYEEALAWYDRAAKAGHAGAQTELARMQLYGIACDPDPHRAVEWLLRAETTGSVIAGYLLAMIGLGGAALPRDGRINHRMLAAVQADYPPAIRAAAIHFGRRPDDADQSLCLQLLGRGSNLGDVVAAQLLVERLARGEGCEAQPLAAQQLAAQLQAHGAAALPAITAAVPPLILPFRESGRAPPGTMALEDALQIPPAVEMSQRPHVMRIDNLLSADECRLLVACAQPGLRRSSAVDPITGEAREMELRTSSDASFDPVIEDIALRVVQLRLARAARVELVQAEHLVVLRYGPGDEYRPHRDYLPPDGVARHRPEAGNRTRTICTYLNHVEAGGETVFPRGDVTVTPVPGRAVVFDNLYPDGSPDPESLHAGLPVTSGEKWLATLWLRERRYRNY